MNALRIVIDGRMFNQSGIGRYTRNLISNLQAIDKKNEYFILHLRDDLQNLKYQTNFHPIITDLKWYGVSEQVKLPKLLKLLNPDLVHFPHFNVPIYYKGKFIVTIHDLIHQHFSMKRATTHGWITYKLKQSGYKFVFKHSLIKSLKILVPSNFVKGQLIKEWQVSADKVVVTPEAVDERIINLSQNKKGKNEKVLESLNIKKPYIFYVGNAHPHKHIEGLIRGFRGIREKYPNLSLVLAGNDHYFWQRLRSQFSDEGIVYTGYISDEQLVALFKDAECFVMPSLEEGFGIPILEAMACSCPVVSSNAGSLVEVGGDAAVYFDPDNLEDMVNKLDLVLKSVNQRKELIDKGLKRYKQFSWKKLAYQTLEVYRQCV